MSTVSICVPTYNGAEYLRPCLDSVLSQTFGDFEVLLVDDCSSDSTPTILNEYSRRDPRIRVVLNERNLGLVGNWNRCVELARGEWIKFVFQDDYIREDCLEKMLAIATRPIVFCRRVFLFEPGTDEEIVCSYSRIPQLPSLVGNISDVGSSEISNALLSESRDFIRNFLGEPTAALLHRSLFERFGLFNPDLAQLCDFEYWIRVSINTGLSYTDDPLATFRFHASSTSAGNRDPAKDERVSVFDHLVMLHEFAYNPHYASLRQHARGAVPKRDFQRELAKKAIWVQARALALAKRDESPDETWIKQWGKLAGHYPRMANSNWHIPYRMYETWLRHIGWRFQ